MRKEITNEDLPNNGGLMYEVVVSCTECDGAIGLGATDSLYEAQEVCQKAEQLTIDEDGNLHNYISAVAEVSRRVVYVPPRDEADI